MIAQVGKNVITRGLGALLKGLFLRVTSVSAAGICEIIPAARPVHGVRTSISDLAVTEFGGVSDYAHISIRTHNHIESITVREAV